MNVQELIDRLLLIDDKTQKCYSFNAEEEIEVIESIWECKEGDFGSNITGIIL